MRDMKFKVWDIKNKCWLKQKGISLSSDGKRVFFYPHTIPSPAIVGKDVIVVFYTGLKDKKRTKEYPKGQEIYEGDILSRRTQATSHLVVKWDRYFAKYHMHGFRLDVHKGFMQGLTAKQAKKHEVIGDIYENKELIK